MSLNNPIECESNSAQFLAKISHNENEKAAFLTDTEKKFLHINVESQEAFRMSRQKKSFFSASSGRRY